MPYLRLTAAISTGSAALNHANDCRRALSTAGICAAGRIGKMRAISSSSAYIRAISRKNALAFFGPMTVRNAEIATRIDTASGVTGGKLSVGGNLFSVPLMREQAALSDDRDLNKHGESRLTHPPITGAVDGLLILGCEAQS